LSSADSAGSAANPRSNIDRKRARIVAEYELNEEDGRVRSQRAPRKIFRRLQDLWTLHVSIALRPLSGGCLNHLHGRKRRRLKSNRTHGPEHVVAGHEHRRQES
jgi:hypothetical protein